MRELKFRVWDIVNKEFNQFPDKQFLIGLGGDLFDAAGGKYDEKHIIQQWTGLKDKEGREIYEGDIIIFDGKWDKGGKVLPPDYAPYEITRFGACLVAYLIQPPHGRSLHEHNEIIHLPYTDNHVIGNIFQNPELLNNK